jgi:hypothetical protein
MTGAELAAGWFLWNLLTGRDSKPKPVKPKLPTQPQAQPRPTPPIVVMPVPVPTASPKPPAAAPTSPSAIPWPAHAGIPGADAVVVPTAPPAPSAAPKPPPPPPVVVDPKQPTMQQGTPAVTAAAQKGIDAMKAQKGTGTGTRQFRPKQKGLTSAEIARAKALLKEWVKGKVWQDSPSIQYRAAQHGTKRAIEVWTSNPDHW